MSIEWKPNLVVEIDPDARKDFTFDFSEWLTEGREIVDHEIVAPDNITIDQSTQEDAEVTFWVSGLAEKDKATVTVRVQLNTSPVFTDDFSIQFRGKQQ